MYTMLTSLRGKFIFIFIIITVSTVMISSGYARYKQRNFALDRAKERAMVNLELINADISSLQQWIQRDLLVLRDLPSLQSLMNSTDADRRSHVLKILEKEFLNLAAHHQIFQQVRLLDSRGMEIVRANTNSTSSWLTPVDKLQDKSDRYYFQQAFDLPNGGIYISPMDLNMEQGKLQRPLLPVIRYATPVFDQKGKKQGVLVLNVFGSSFLNLLAIQQDSPHGKEQFFLLNQDGYFLYHQQTEKSFGFVLGHETTLFQAEPQLMGWLGKNHRDISIATSEETGKQTLFAYVRIPLGSFENPLASSNVDSSICSEGTSHCWILVTTLDDADLLLGFNEYVQSFMRFTMLLVGVCVIVAVLVAWSFSRPIISLAAAASEIQKGDLSARATVYSRDDMGKFGHLFNAMAVNLESTIARLKQSESKYRRLFENSQDCIFVTDDQCRIIDLNEAGRELFGVGQGDIPETLTIGCCKQASDEGETDVKAQMYETGAVRDTEIVVTRLDGRVRDCILTATARIDKDGNMLGVEGVLRDVTELRIREKKEQALRKRVREEIILAEERERRHLGQVLHEEMAQNLAVVNLRLQEAEQRSCPNHGGVEQVPVCMEKELVETRGMVKVMIGQIRTMIFDLYPQVLDDRGLVAAMDWYGNNYSGRTGLDVSVYGGEEDLGLTDSQKIYLFRAFKELLHNAWKHGGGTEVVATVKRRDNNVRLTVDDEGQGFDPASIKDLDNELTGIGLVSIQEWVVSMDGTIKIESEKGTGCRVILDIPVS